VDVRRPRSFKDIDSELHPTRKQGHILKSINLPYLALMDPEKNGIFKYFAVISSVMNSVGLDFSGPIVKSCGSGVSACVAALVVYLIGRTEVAVCDSSWADWGDNLILPVKRGAIQIP